VQGYEGYPRVGARSRSEVLLVCSFLDIDISHGTPTVGPGTARQDWELGLTFSPIGGTRMAVGLLWDYGNFLWDCKQRKLQKTRD
jgi:hypothetical protein